MGAVSKRIRRQERGIQPYVYDPLPGFRKRAPGVWIPDGYHPSQFEMPTPVVQTPEDAAREYRRCQRSLSYFAFSACWSLHTDDLGGAPVFRKFPQYDYMKEFFAQAQEPQNLHVEKSRQLLMSWAWMVVFLWDISFHDTWANLAVSRKEVLVDDGGDASTTDSLFGKLRVLWRSLPEHLQHPLVFRHMRVSCPATNSYVKGESGGSGSGGRGASYKRALLDEAAHIARSESLFRAVHEAAKHGLVLNSTPLGKANVFARIRFQPRTSFKRLSFHWTHHPEKAMGLYCNCGWQSVDDAAVAIGPKRTRRQQFDDHVCPKPEDVTEHIVRLPRSPWYDHATADYTPEGIASEFDLSYERSMRGRVYEPFEETRHVKDYVQVIGMRREHESALVYRKRYLRAVLNPLLPTVVGWDFGVGDPTSLVLGQVIDDHMMKIRWLDEHEMTDRGWSYYHTFVQGLWAPLVQECTGQDILHYGDPSGANRGHDLESWCSNLAASDPPIVIIRGPKMGSKLQWLDLIADLIRRGQFEVSLWAAHLIDALGQYHFPLDGEGNPVPGAHEPVHDQWSHMMDAMRYVYMFRYHDRLRDVYARGVTVSQLLAIGADDKPEKVPLEF